MKQKFLLKTMFLLCALVAGSSSVWADTVTFGTADFSGQGTSGSGSVITATKSGVTFTCDKGYGTSEIRCYSGGDITISSSNTITITEISFTFADTSKKGGLNDSYTGLSTNSWEFTLTSQARLSEISVTFTSADTRTPVNISTVSVEPTSLVKGSGSSAQAAATCTPACESASYTYESLNTDIALCTAEGVITPVSKGIATIKATLVIPGDDENYRIGTTYTKTTTIEILNPHTAKFSINDVIDDNNNVVVEEGETITFPANPASISGLDFVGWSAMALSGTQTTAPSFVNTATETMGDTDVTYYAVFAKVTGNEPAGWIETALADMTASDVFVFSNGTYAMNNDGGASSAPSQNSITVSGGKITSEVADNLKWNVSGNATNGYTFHPNGSTTTWLYCTTTASSGSNNNIRVGTGDRKLWIFTASGYLKTNDSNTDRYLSIYSTQDFRGYINTDNAFVPKFYKYTEGSITATDYCTTVIPGPSDPDDNGTTITLQTTANMAGWRAFYDASQAYEVDEYTKIYVVKAKSATANVVELTALEATKIPAATPVILKTSDTNFEMTLTKVTSADGLGDNLLTATDGTHDADGYRLGYKGGIGVAFFKYTATAPAAGIVYIDATNIKTSSGAPEFLLIGSEATGVNDVRSKMEEVRGEYFNLNGQRVAQPTKGLYIVNGHKVVIK